MTRFVLFTTLTLLAVFPTLTSGVGETQALPHIPDRTNLTYKAATALTPKEIANGWIQLFDGETTFGWNAPKNDRDGSASDWHAADNTLISDGTQGGEINTTTAFGDFELRAEYQVEKETDGGIGMIWPVRERTTPEMQALFGLRAFDPRTAGKWLPLRIVVDGSHVTATINGHTQSPSTPMFDSRSRCRILLKHGQNSAPLRLRNLVLRPLGGKSLFNGKNLTGWKPIAGHASVFSVTPQGWLNIKNGNGEIQSTTTARDFVLQWEVFSNGDHLNSGVFTREDPGAFWGGYEDQIRNQWQGDDRTKAVDFGTGGLYFYQPARRVASSDREWFTMTLVADGRHFGSWVNGYMVADWTDTRPETQGSARGGARLTAGVIGLQGHDPTTDLYFRNLRLAELPVAKP